jgi:hypothetical protein
MEQFRAQRCGAKEIRCGDRAAIGQFAIQFGNRFFPSAN